MKQLSRLTPHHRLSLNPLFVLGVRRGASADELLNSGGRRALTVCAVLVAIWLLLGLTPFSAGRAFFVSLVLLFSLLATPILDLIYVSASVGSINGDVAAGRWDLLRLTNLRPSQIVAAKHGAGQVRVWRTMTLIAAVRLAVLLLSVLGFVSDLVANWRYFTSLSDATSYAFLFSGYFASLAVYCIGVIEPLWRMRAVTALGVAISARAAYTSAALVAVGALVAFWLVQAILLVVLGIGFSLLFVPLLLLEASAGIFCASPLLILAVLGVAAYGFFTTVQTWSLRRAERAITRIGESRMN